MTVQSWENNSIIVECADPQPQDIRHALDNRQVVWRYKNERIQVLAQTLSSFLDTRTSSLLAVNKKQGVPAKYIHRQWKQTWIDLKGLKQRVQHTEHGSALLKGLKQVIQALDELMALDDNLVKTAAPASAPSGTKRKPIDICEVAMEANKRAVQNTERLNKLTRDEAALENLIFKYRDACSIDLGTQSKRLDRMFNDLRNLGLHVFGTDYNQIPDNTLGLFNRLTDRVKTLESREHQYMSDFNSYGKALNKLETRCDNEHDALTRESRLGKSRVNQLMNRVRDLEDRVTVITAGDKKAAQLMAAKHTPFDALSKRVNRMATQADRLDSKTDGLTSRVSVLEDTSKWLSWSLAGLVSLRLLGLTFRLLRRQ